MFLITLPIKLTKKYNVPIENTNNYRVFDIIPLRETIFLPFPSFVLWYYISKHISTNKINPLKLFFESIISMFLTGFIIHKLFGINSKLGWILCITNKPAPRRSLATSWDPS